MRRRRKSVRLFDNALLERLSHTHPLLPLALWAPLAAWFLWQSWAGGQLDNPLVGVLVAAGLIGVSLSMRSIGSCSTEHRPRPSGSAYSLSFMGSITRTPTIRRVSCCR